MGAYNPIRKVQGISSRYYRRKNYTTSSTNTGLRRIPKTACIAWVSYHFLSMMYFNAFTLKPFSGHSSPDQIQIRALIRETFASPPCTGKTLWFPPDNICLLGDTFIQSEFQSCVIYYLRMGGPRKTKPLSCHFKLHALPTEGKTWGQMWWNRGKAVFWGEGTERLAQLWVPR